MKANKRESKTRRAATPKERVLKKYPKAEWCETCYCIHPDGQGGDLCEERTEDEAWESAARAL